MSKRVLVKDFLILLCFVLVLSACGGGQNANNNDDPIYSVSGSAVKGPLSNATVNIYSIDPQSQSLVGTLVASGTTSNTAEFNNLTIKAASLSAAYLIEVTANQGTVDLSTNSYPVISLMRGIVSSAQLSEGARVSVTPLTTLAIELGRLKSSLQSSQAEVLANINLAAGEVISVLGFGLYQNVDIFTAPALILEGDDTDLASIAAYRSSIEALTALIAMLDDYSAATPDELLLALASDVSDGQLDGKSLNGDVAALAQIADFANLVKGAPIALLPIPNTDKDGLISTEDAYQVDEVEQLLGYEAGVMGVNRDVTVLHNGAVQFTPSPLSPDSDGDNVPDLADSDMDNDGVENGVDAFPLDPTESVDSDGDGVGDNGDAYPDQEACSAMMDGDGTTCYATLLATQTISKIFTDQSGVVYLFVPSRSEVIRFDGRAMHYMQAIPLSTPTTVTSMIYSDSHQRLYVGYSSGSITYVDVTDALSERSFASVPSSVRGLAAVGKFVLAQDESGAWATHYIFNQAGALTDSAEWNYYSRVYAWNPVNNRVYFFRDDTSPNDLHYEEINQSTGLITGAGETPYHGDFLISPPIRISQNGALVLLGSGDVYDAQTLVWQGALGGGMAEATWGPNGELVTLFSISGKTLLKRHHSDLKTIVESLNYDGVPLGVFSNGPNYIVVTQSNTSLNIESYRPSDDSDHDGVTNLDDAFPLDPAASVDTDHDGYPDSWNVGYTETDSSTGLRLDSYPQDSACYLLEHGDGVNCDYASTMPVFVPNQTVADDDGDIYLLSSSNNRVFRWSSASGAFTNPIYVGSTTGLLTTSPIKMAYSPAHHRLYFGYTSGLITYVDINGDLGEHPFANLPTSVRGLASVGAYILAQDSSGAWATHYIFDQSGTLTDSAEWNYFSRVYTWNGVNNRVYFFRDETSPNDLQYEEINQGTGKITGEGETPYHGTYSIAPPIRISPNGSTVLLGSGDVYDAASLNWTVSLGSTLNDAVWFNDTLITSRVTGAASSIQIYDVGAYQLITQFPVFGTTVALFPYGQDIIRVFSDTTGISVEVMLISDHDGDGLPAWWENRYGLNDGDATDASVDSDGDGLTNAQEFFYRTQPNNADTDSDGLTDSTELLTELTDPLNSDSDADGISDGDEVNTYNTDPLSSDTDADTLSDFAEIEQYGTSPISPDTDGDGMDDALEVANGLDPLTDDAGADADSDGLTNLAEFSYGTDPNNADTDGDGLLDGEEVSTYITNPIVFDTDGDRMNDGWEVANSFDPLYLADGMQDPDSDGFTNMAEYFLKTDPNDASSVPMASAWTTYQGNAAHNGFVPVILDVSNFTRRWTVTPFNGHALNPIVAASGEVFVSEKSYFASNQSLVALDAVDGSVIWQKGFGSIHSIDPPAYADGKVYFQTGGHADSYLRALDAQTGALIFRSGYENQWSTYSAPTPYAGNIYISGGYYGGDYGFSGTTGDQLWVNSLSQNDKWTPAVDENFVYVFNSGPRLVAQNRISGGSEFSIDDPNFVFYGGDSLTPVLGGNHNVLAVNGGRLVNFDLQRRSIAWQRTSNFVGQPSYALGRIYVNNSGALNVIDEITGSTQWAWEPPGGGSISGDIVVAMNLVFVHDGATTYAVDLDSHLEIWSYPAAGHLALSNEGALYIATSAGRLVAISTSGDSDGDGMPQWWELAYGFNDNDISDSTLDPDGDGLSNLLEYQNAVNPFKADTDSDGISDGDEVAVYNTNPKLADTDNDGLNEGEEILTYLTNPLAIDTDGDGFKDGDEVHLYGTDPNDAASLPPYIGILAESFEGLSMPAGWTESAISSASWVIDSTFASDGSQSLRSGAIPDSQQSGIEFKGLFAAGTLSFSARVDSESCCDKLYFYIDGVLVNTISANLSWSVINAAISSGEHTLEWRYVKDSSVIRGADAAWIDNIVFAGT